LPPNINRSESEFYPEGGNSIRFGLGAIKNVGIKLCELIVKERAENGEYKHFDDFIDRIGMGNMNKKNLECLIKAGALDDFGDRGALLHIMPEVIEKYNYREKNKDSEQESLFSFDAELEAQVNQTQIPTSVENAKDSDKMVWEKELLGVYITTHPLNRFNWIKLRDDFNMTDELDKLEQNKIIKLLGIITSIKYTFTKKDNQKMAIITIEDIKGKTEAVLFPRVFDKFQHYLLEGTPLIFMGSINIRDDRRSIIIDSVEHGNTLLKPKNIEINLIGVTDREKMEELKKCFTDEGETNVVISYGTPQNIKTIEKKINIDDYAVINCISQWV
jgi:DNA polymerase-3 subunit alpha